MNGRKGLRRTYKDSENMNLTSEDLQTRLLSVPSLPITDEYTRNTQLRVQLAQRIDELEEKGMDEWTLDECLLHDVFMAWTRERDQKLQKLREEASEGKEVSKSLRQEVQTLEKEVKAMRERHDVLMT